MEDYAMSKIVIDREQIMSDLHSAHTVLRELNNDKQNELVEETRELLNSVMQTVIDAHAFIHNNCSEFEKESND